MNYPFLIIILAFFVPSASFSQSKQNTYQKANELYVRLTTFNDQSALKTFDHQDRIHFSYFPASGTGMPLKEMDMVLRDMTFDLLQMLLSDTGMNKVRDIIELEDILRESEGRPIGNTYRDQGKYYLNFFGKPSETEPWAISFEGHHISLNFTFTGTKLSGTPLFFGANPAKVLIDRRKGWRVLKDEEDLARKLVSSLNDQQKQLAIISTRAPYDITSRARTKIEIKDFEGILFSQLNKNQQMILKDLVHVYIDRLEAEQANKYLNKIESWGWNSIYFAWAGGIDPGQPHYYKITGPTLLIEYDNTQNGANHIHTVWRDSEGDFGENLLKEHYKNSPHHH